LVAYRIASATIIFLPEHLLTDLQVQRRSGTRPCCRILRLGLLAAPPPACW
jgi:hypothetical protein